MQFIRRFLMSITDVTFDSSVNVVNVLFVCLFLFQPFYLCCYLTNKVVYSRRGNFAGSVFRCVLWLNDATYIIKSI